jgi:phospholipid/cholesterol/gamma-HCH transport system permease protein
MERVAADKDVRHVCIDFSAVERLDSAGVAAFWLGRQQLERAGKGLELRALAPAHDAAFALHGSRVETPRTDAPRERAGVKVAAWLRRIWASFAELAELATDTAWASIRCLVGNQRLPSGSLAEQVVRIGVDAVPIVALLSLLLGVVLTFQSVFQLRDFGAQQYAADLVAVGMVREFAGIITAIIVTGRSGAAIAAELGSMSVQEELDALRTMGISPIRFLVVPRMIAMMFAVPALTLISMAIGIVAGLMIAPLLGLSWQNLYGRMMWSLELNDFALGLSKSVLFGLSIGLIGCFMGLRTQGGPSSVGAAATRAVVAGVFFIILIDSVVTTAWTIGHYE